MEQIFEAEETRTLDAADCTRLSLMNTNGNVVAEGSDEESITLRAVKKVKASSEAEAQERLNAIRIVVSERKPALDIVTDDSALSPKGKYSVDYTLRIPKRMVSSLGVANGNVTVSGIAAETSACAQNGNVRASGIGGRTNAATTNGNVHAQDVAGPLEAKTVNGNVHALRIEGQAEGRTVNGNIHAEDVAGQAVGHTQNGNVELSRISGPASGSATNGNVHATLTKWEPGYKVHFRTRNGNATLVAPESTSARVSASAPNGRAQCDLPFHASAQTRTNLEGLIGSGEGQIDLRTTNGNARIQRA